MELKVPRQADGSVYAALYNGSKKKMDFLKSENNPYLHTKKKLVKPGTYYICVYSIVNRDSNAMPNWDYQIRLKTSKISQSITVNHKSLELYAGGKSKILKVFHAKGKITYKSRNPKVATINAKGRVIPKKAGKTTITIKAAGNSSYKPATIKVKVTVKKRFIKNK